MRRSASAVRAEHDVIRLSHSGLDTTGVRREVLRALRRVVPSDATFFATADPETLLFTGAWPDPPLDTATPLFLDNEFGGGDVNTFAGLVTSGRPVATLDGATGRDRWASERYREIMRPLGLGDEMRAALVTGGRCWGYLCLHREDGLLGFTATEKTALARLAPHLAHAIRTAALVDGPAAADHRPGVVLLTDDLRLVSLTPDAEHLLSLLPPGAPLPLPVYAVAAALRSGSALPSARVRGADGSWLTLHASRLTGTGQLAVVVEPAEARAAAPLVLAAHGLTTREADVATLVLRGLPTRAISDQLHISAHTVQDHLKAVFDKVGVRSRRDLVIRLLG
ncbi:helix-turn-helix transcriptional regulator [Amycolatopsis thermoflava]|uniref:LuxR family GAF modulated transcriptional regulator n=1 Tax=Amycolatopsis thermoflava TaxID=84480 RepID=A0A3N2GX18_9PSEU|nr:LuxR C-terminal-related transcriptional regulator [Amycolatopsis thermoflava]ROS41184.1 LuxR family GAF modulated transcriptional regulator [Amycolatopsis thermoflava]